VSDIDLTQLDRALAAAHQPALQAALVHLTGQDHWLRPEWTPAYVPLSRGDTGVPEAEQQKFLAEAKVALVQWFTKGQGRTHQPPAASATTSSTPPAIPTMRQGTEEPSRSTR
jgi:hypothetical protein